MARQRSIYETGTYETPLADFLEQIPDYFIKWEALKQTEKRQNRLDEDVRVQRNIDNLKWVQGQKDKDVTRTTNAYNTAIQNEEDAIKMLPSHLRVNAMKTSSVQHIQKAGESAYQEEQSFLKRLEPIDASLVGKPAEKIKHLSGLLEQPDIASNPNRVNQINQRITNLKRDLAKNEIEDYFKDYPDVYDISEQERIMAQAELDPTNALKSLKKPTGDVTFPSAVSYLNKLSERREFGDLRDITQEAYDKMVVDAQRMVDQYTPSGKAKIQLERKGKRIASEILEEHPWVKPGSDLLQKELSARMGGSSVIEGRTEQEYLDAQKTREQSSGVLLPEGVTQETFYADIPPVAGAGEGITEEEDVDIPAILGNLQAGAVASVPADTTVTAPLPPAEPVPADTVTVPVDTTTVPPVKPEVVPAPPKDEFVGVEETAEGGLTPKDGKYKNVEGVSSTVTGAIKNIERMKPIYEATEDGTEKKRLLLVRIAAEQQKIIDLIEPFISKKTGNFKNKDFNKTFYSRISKKTKIPEPELKGLILNNLQYSLL